LKGYIKGKRFYGGERAAFSGKMEREEKSGYRRGLKDSSNTHKGWA